MELTLSVVLAAMVFFSLLITCAVILGRGPSDVVLLFVLVFCLFYGFRPLIFVLGLDGPHPTDLFFLGTLPSLLTRTLLGLSLFLAMAMLGIAAVTRSGARGWAPFFAEKETDLRRALAVTFVLTAVGALVSAYLMARYGGVGGVIVAGKYDKALAGLYWLRSVSAVGAVLAVTTFIDLRRQGCTSRTLTYLPLVCAFANAFFVFMWGSRGVLVVVAATLVLGVQRHRRHQRRVRRERVLVRLLVACALVIVAASGMRMVRDTLSHGEVQANYAASSAWRQASVGTNSIYFDAAMLSFRDWPSTQRFRGGEDFYEGILGAVPRMIWPGKPTGIPPGKWFRQVYEPRKLNGWPMGAGALWYLNFGWLGLPLGGLISGLVIGMVAAAQRRRPRSGFNTGVAVIAAVFVFPLGWDNQVPMKFIIWLGPMWLLARYLAPRGGGPRRRLRSLPDADVTKSWDARPMSRT
ncbi:O-antigen polysaccharide polymerase Wzy [Nocardioides sp. Soil805]|uniref:O-antigen polysaccharide polymerase Wzy n=1 Tax=Nocardioides sp. Soil805 TaxID=1736416 RepID=UPI000703881A|nr:O-antigen polysaccharide polymerase Wzy [Nocardioides sp. Soil805]KRF36853.1 hypothetical protein ASG94_05495 [Nocardioides sp. Soil805]